MKLIIDYDEIGVVDDGEDALDENEVIEKAYKLIQDNFPSFDLAYLVESPYVDYLYERVEFDVINIDTIVER